MFQSKFSGEKIGLHKFESKFWPTDLFCPNEKDSKKRFNFITKAIGSYSIVNNEMNIDTLPSVVNNQYFNNPASVSVKVRTIPKEDAYPKSPGGYDRIDELLQFINEKEIRLKSLGINFVCSRHLLKKFLLASIKKFNKDWQIMAYKRNGIIYLANLKGPTKESSGHPLGNGLDFEEFLLNGEYNKYFFSNPK